MLRQEDEKKSEFGARKMPSPLPTTPPIPSVFIVYTVTTYTTLVESTNCVFSSHLFIHACKSEKTSKKPSQGRVKGKVRPIETLVLLIVVLFKNSILFLPELKLTP